MDYWLSYKGRYDCFFGNEFLKVDRVRVKFEFFFRKKNVY